MTGTSAAFSDYIVVREQSVHKLADTCSLKKGALIEPISVCLHGIDLIGIKPGQSVAISGGGTMGMIMTQLALHSGGTNITVIEPIAMKQRNGKEAGRRTHHRSSQSGPQGRSNEDHGRTRL